MSQPIPVLLKFTRFLSKDKSQTLSSICPSPCDDRGKDRKCFSFYGALRITKYAIIRTIKAIFSASNYLQKVNRRNQSFTTLLKDSMKSKSVEPIFDWSVSVWHSPPIQKLHQLLGLYSQNSHKCNVEQTAIVTPDNWTEWLL